MTFETSVEKHNISRTYPIDDGWSPGRLNTVLLNLADRKEKMTQQHEFSRITISL
jgi:hypothetical protein